MRIKVLYGTSPKQISGYAPGSNSNSKSVYVEKGKREYLL